MNCDWWEVSFLLIIRLEFRISYYEATLLMRHLLLISWLLCSVMALAQGDDPLGGRDTIVLENERLQDVIDSDKPFYKADYQEISTDTDEQLTYESEAFYVETDFDPAPPEVKPLQPERPMPERNNLLRLGIGRFVTPLAEIYLHNGPDSEMEYGLYYQHQSAYRDRIELRRFSQNRGGISGRAQNDFAAIAAGLEFSHLGYFNYAGDTLLDLGPELRDSLDQDDLDGRVQDSLRMRYVQWQAHLNLMSLRGMGYDYDLGVRLRLHNDFRDNQEFHLSALPQGSVELNEQVSVGLSSELTYVRGRIDTLRQNRFFLRLAPTLRFHTERWHGQVGVRYDYFDNSTAEGGTDLLVPELRLSFVAIPERLEINAGYVGGMTHHHYYHMIAANPYLSPNVDIRPTLTNMDIFLGVDGNVGQRFNFAGKAYYRRISDQLIYRTEDSIFFRPVYDDLMTVVGTHLEVNYDAGSALLVGAALNLNVYNTSNQDSLTPRFFHAPPLRLDVYGTYLALEDKLTTKATFSLLGPTPMSVDSAAEIISRNSFFGLNASADYQVTPNFSVFLAVNNLLGIQYERWYYYPERRFDIRGGATLTF